MIGQITRTYTRHYSDNGQTRTYVEWIDDKGNPGRTEGRASNAHMASLLARARREAITHEQERW